MKKIIIALIVLTAVQFGCTKLDEKLYDRIPADEFTPDPVLKNEPNLCAHARIS